MAAAAKTQPPPPRQWKMHLAILQPPPPRQRSRLETILQPPPPRQRTLQPAVQISRRPAAAAAAENAARKKEKAHQAAVVRRQQVEQQRQRVAAQQLTYYHDQQRQEENLRQVNVRWRELGLAPLDAQFGLVLVPEHLCHQQLEQVQPQDLFRVNEDEDNRTQQAKAEDKQRQVRLLFLGERLGQGCK